MQNEVRPIGPDQILLHVGPHKTGTTAIQGAFKKARETMRTHGVLYPGTRRSHSHEARAITGVNTTKGAPSPDINTWKHLVREVNAHPGRSIVSSEFFDAATPETARRIAAEFGDRLQIVITAATLESLLPSNWQQMVRGTYTRSFHDWLRLIFEHPDSKTAQNFWSVQRIDKTARMWSEIVGTANVTVLVVDKARPRQLFDGFEQLLDLPAETLQPIHRSKNRSFSYVEAELFRQVNKRVRANRWPHTVHARFIRLGAAREVTLDRKPPKSEPKIRLPQWARTHAVGVSNDIIEGLDALDVNVYGTLDSLRITPDQPSHDEQLSGEVQTVDMDLAVTAIIGAARGGGADILQEPWVDARSQKIYPGVAGAPADVLIDELKVRARHTTRRQLSRWRKRLKNLGDSKK